MGARAVRLVDWTARGCRLALAGSIAVVAIGTASDFGWTVPIEVAIERGLAEAGSPEALDAKTRAALDADDVVLARGLADLAVDLKHPLPAETLKRLEAAEAPAAVAMRNARGAARGFVTGEADGTAALAGALASDLTVVGDVRDLAREGLKLARGEEASELILGLAAAGVAITAATYLSAGGAAPARFGVSVLKAARRTGAMTADFAADLGRRVARTSTRGADDAARGARNLAMLSGAAGELRAVGGAVGAGETVRLMRYVRAVDELPELRRFTERFGLRSRAVAELMGKASLRAFRTTIRLGAWVLENLIALLAWFGSLIAGALSGAGWRGLRVVAARA